MNKILFKTLGSVIIIFALSTLSIAQARQIIGKSIPGLKFIESCKNYLKKNATKREKRLSYRCLDLIAGLRYGYFAGHVTAIRETQGAHNIEKYEHIKAFCIPDKSANMEVIRTVMKYVRNDPTVKTYDAITITVLALVNGYPCKKATMGTVNPNIIWVLSIVPDYKSKTMSFGFKTKRECMKAEKIMTNSFYSNGMRKKPKHVMCNSWEKPGLP